MSDDRSEQKREASRELHLLRLLESSVRRWMQHDDDIHGALDKLDTLRETREAAQRVMQRQDKTFRKLAADDELQRLRALCAAAYQIVGTVAAEQYVDPEYPGRFEKLMDLLGAAGNGEPIYVDPIETLLPFPALPEKS
jgi:hypothetical protein